MPPEPPVGRIVVRDMPERSAAHGSRRQVSDRPNKSISERIRSIVLMNYMQLECLDERAADTQQRCLTNCHVFLRIGERPRADPMSGDRGACEIRARSPVSSLKPEGAQEGRRSYVWCC